jgi:hypothetical protein
MSTSTSGVRTSQFTLEPDIGWTKRGTKLLHTALSSRCAIREDEILDRVEACVLALAHAAVEARGGDMSIGLIREERLLRVELTDQRYGRAELTVPQVVEEKADVCGWELLQPRGARVWCTFLVDAPDGPVIE